MPLIFVLGGAGSQFLSLLISKFILNHSDFIYFAYYSVLINVCSMFVSLGSENLIVRLSKVEGKCLLLNRRVGWLIISATCVFFVLMQVFVFGGVWLEPIASVCLLTATCIFTSNILGQVLRSLSLFSQSTFVLNLWRFLLVPILCITYFFDFNLAVVINVTMTLCLIFYFVFTVLFINVKWTGSAVKKTGLSKLFWSYLISILSLSVLVNFDRYFIETLVSSEHFANYVFIFNVYVTPFVVVSNYFGFKEAVRYKDCFVRSDYVAKVLSVVAIVVIVFILYSVVLGHFKEYFLLDEPWLWFAFLLIVLLRALYSVNSAIFGVIVSPNAMLGTNVFFMFILVFSVFVMLMWSADITFYAIVLSSALLWSARNMLYMISIFRTV